MGATIAMMLMNLLFIGYFAYLAVPVFYTQYSEKARDLASKVQLTANGAKAEPNATCDANKQEKGYYAREADDKEMDESVTSPLSPRKNKRKKSSPNPIGSPDRTTRVSRPNAVVATFEEVQTKDK